MLLGFWGQEGSWGCEGSALGSYSLPPGSAAALCQGLCAPFFWGGPRLALVPLWGFPFWVGPPGVFFFLA